VISGPSFAKEVARGDPTAITIASQDSQLAEMIQREFSDGGAYGVRLDYSFDGPTLPAIAYTYRSTKRVSDQELRQMLIEEVKRQNKPYGLFFDQVTGGYTTTARRGLQAFTVIPLVVYRVYPDGRPDELIRGVSIVGTPLASFASILATSEKRAVFNGICGAESGNVPVAAISPALRMVKVLDELDLLKKVAIPA
jgi:hypothetical protein